MIDAVAGGRDAFRRAVERRQHGAIGGDYLQPHYEAAHHAVAEHVDPSGIGREVAADLATSLSTQA